MASVDMELKKAFQELQNKMITTQQQLKISDMQIETHKRQIVHAKLVDNELANIPEGTKTYEGVGRMFVLQPISTIKLGLTEKLKQADEKIKTLENNKTYLEKSMKESEDNLREMVMSRQQQK